MRVLIIGFGSIGQRHYRILRNLVDKKNITVISKQNLPNTDVYKTLDSVPSLSTYNYFIIASETHLHYAQLKYLCQHLDNKVILVEKPLFAVAHPKLACSNTILTAYNMRFHPVIQKLQSLMQNKPVYAAHIYCGSYLPRWRPNQDYTKGYSADKKRGGGVLRDLSHELDYIKHLFGEISTFEAINSKISDLDITSNDFFTMIAVTKQKTVINLSLDYISKLHRRKILIHTQNESIEADLINNTIEVQNKDGKSEQFTFEEADRDYTYIKMHEAIVANNFTHFCTYDEGLETTNLIDAVSFKKEF